MRSSKRFSGLLSIGPTMSEVGFIDTPAGRAQLKRTSRRTLAISVLPDGTLELVAPARAGLADINAKVARRMSWIETHRNRFAEMNASRRVPRFVKGATHRYLGRQYRLKIVPGPSNTVAMRGGLIVITTWEDHEQAVRELLERWYREKANVHFIERVKKWEPWCAHRGLAKPKARLRSMPKRWGSACKNGVILLNPELIKAPSACIDYVITHEICHLRHPNHGPAFSRLLSTLSPNWRTLKARLEAAEI